MPGTPRSAAPGWVYPDWRGVVYPGSSPQRCWFEHYAARFDTVEINNTFYRLPTAAAVEGWAAQAPPGFVYAVKLGGFGSHRMKLRDAESWLPNHLDRVDRLGRAPRSEPRAAAAPLEARRRPTRRVPRRSPRQRIRWAVELREPSWLHDDTFDVLARHGAALCIHDLLPSHPWERTAADWAYVRFHGPEPWAARTTAATPAGACGGPPSASAHGSTTAPTSSPTSTTTGTAPPSRTPPGWAAPGLRARSGAESAR